MISDREQWSAALMRIHVFSDPILSPLIMRLMVWCGTPEALTRAFREIPRDARYLLSLVPVVHSASMRFDVPMAYGDA